MNDPRLEHLLIQIARRYAPRRAPTDWQRPGDYRGGLPELASSLAGYNVLVMMGAVPPEYAAAAQAQIAAWVDHYVRFYDLVTQALFPSFTQINAFFADQDAPPVVFLVGAATPVILALSGYIVPYVASRQWRADVSEFELRGLMDMVLDELEAGDLPRDEYRQLCDQGVAQLRQLLNAPVRQRLLAEADSELVNTFSIEETQLLSVTAAPTDTPPFPPPADLPEAPPPPDILPEQENLSAEPGAIQPPPFNSETPIFFDPAARGKHPPPLPDLPKE